MRATMKPPRRPIDAPPEYRDAPDDPRLGDLVDGPEAKRQETAEALGRLRAGSDLSLLLAAIESPHNASPEATGVRKALYDALAWHDDQRAFACLVNALEHERDDSVAEWVNGVLWRQEQGVERLADLMVAAYSKVPIDDRFAFRLTRAAKALDLELSTVAARDDAPPLMKRRCGLLPERYEQDLDDDRALECAVERLVSDGSTVRFALEGSELGDGPDASPEARAKVRERDGARIRELCVDADPRVRGHALEVARVVGVEVDGPPPGDMTTGELALREAEPEDLPPAHVHPLHDGYVQRGPAPWLIVDSQWLLHPDGQMRPIARDGQQWAPGVFVDVGGTTHYVDIQRVDTRAKHARPTLALVWTSLGETSSEVVREQKWKGGISQVLRIEQDLLLDTGAGVVRRRGTPKGKSRWTAGGLRRPRLLELVGAAAPEIYVETEDGIARLHPDSGELAWLSPELACSNMIDCVGRFDDLLVCIDHGIVFIADAQTGRLRRAVPLPDGFYPHGLLRGGDGSLVISDGTRFIGDEVCSGLAVTSSATLEDASRSLAQVEQTLTVRDVECRATPRALWSVADPKRGVRFEEPLTDLGPDTPAGLIVKVGDTWSCLDTKVFANG